MARRLVSLCPSTTETLFALGLGPDLVGRTKFCVEPAGEVEAATSIGGTKDPRIDRILALDPTLVFANQEENRREDVRALEAAGVPVHTTFPRGPADVPAMIRSQGDAAGAATDRVEEAAQRVRRALDEVRAAAGDEDPTSFVVLIWRGPWMAAGTDTFLSRLLEVAGGHNLMGDTEIRYPEISLEGLAEARPRLVLLPSEPFPFGPRHVDELVRVTRIDPARFVRCDGQLLTWHGVRTAAGLRAARDWIVRARAR